MKNKDIVEAVAKMVQKKFEDEASGHDWWHIYRVWQTAKSISKIEKADLFIVELGALLHDIADWKFNSGDLTAGGKEAEKILLLFNIDQNTIQRVKDIIDQVSFKGDAIETPMSSIEGKIVQDADRLDAIGAIGIARTFAYGGNKGRPMYSPNIKPQLNQTFESYKNSTAPTINHFYEKLLLLKDRMNTQTGKSMAEQRHLFMETYLKQFYDEWNGEL